MRKYVIGIAVLIIVTLLFVFSSPVRAIKADALMMGCPLKDVVAAEFQKLNDSDSHSWGDKYITDSGLYDKLTGTGHADWYVHKILFIYIPKWAGNG